MTPIEDEAKKRWKDTLERASQMGVTNDYVIKARENLSKYLPDEFCRFVKTSALAWSTRKWHASGPAAVACWPW